MITKEISMAALHEILTDIQEEIGGDDHCRVVVDLGRDGSLRFTAAWDDSSWNYQTLFTKTQIESIRNSAFLVNLFVTLVKDSEEYRGRQWGAG